MKPAVGGSLRWGEACLPGPSKEFLRPRRTAQANFLFCQIEVVIHFSIDVISHHAEGFAVDGD